VPASLAAADIAPTPPTIPSPVATCSTKSADWIPAQFQPPPANSAPKVSGCQLVINPDTAGVANAVWYKSALSLSGRALDVSFNAIINGGNPIFHANGMTFALVDATQANDIVTGNPPHLDLLVGAGGDGLGFENANPDIEGGNPTVPMNNANIAIGLTTFDSAANGGVGAITSGVGILGDKVPPISQRWLSGGGKPTPVSQLFGHSTPVAISIYPSGAAGHYDVTVRVNGATTVHQNVAIPNKVFIGFTGSTGGFSQSNAVSNVSIKYGTPTVTPSVQSLAFGAVQIGHTSAPKTVAFTTSTGPARSISKGTVTGPFNVSLSGGTTPASAIVTFSPTQAGARTGSFTINVAGGASQTISLSGTGTINPPPPTESGLPFRALTPSRLLDTRTNGGPLGPGSVRTIKVTGKNGVPAGGVGAVVLNVTVTEPTAPGYITVYPNGQSPPTASNLNFVPGQNIANMVTAKVGVNGSVNIFNFAGNTQVLFDVVGYFPTAPAALLGSAGQGGQYVSLAPNRFLDTRQTHQTLGPNGQLDLQITGRGGIPGSGVAAVVMNLTATNTTAAGFLTAWPTGSTRQTTSNLNFGPGQFVPNLAVVPVGVGGKVSIYNFAGSTDVIADVVGWFTKPGVSVPGGSTFHPLAPSRILDTRNGTGTDKLPLGPNQFLTLSVLNKGGVPGTGVSAVMMNTTATNTTAAGFLTVWPSGGPLPTASNLDFVAGQTVPNLVISKLSLEGQISVYNFAGNTDVVGDVSGYFGA
jgi:hypothetical protein